MSNNKISARCVCFCGAEASISDTNMQSDDARAALSHWHQEQQTQADKTGFSLCFLCHPSDESVDESHFDMQIQPCAAYALLFIWLPIDLE
jgi:hypothetical protein